MSVNTIVVTGAGGQVARALAITAPPEAQVTWLSHSDLELADAPSVAAHPALAAADLVINTAAYTRVDAAETDEEAARLTNVTGPRNLAERCVQTGAKLVHLSTDYVFGAHAPRRPLRPEDPVAPDSVYGRTKLAGEQAVLESGARALVARTAWVYTGGSHRDFVTIMRDAALAGRQVRVVDDQEGSPTYSVDLARALWQVAHEREGLIHLAGSERATWFDLARAVFWQVGASPELVAPTDTAGYPTPATRPAWSVLDSAVELPGWRDALPRALR